MFAIDVQDIKKYYGATRAVDGISFSIEPGEIFGLLGPNGAGKTTTTEIVEGLRVPDSGSVRVLGLDVLREPQRVKSLIGVQFQTTALYPRLTVREVLELFRTFFPGEKRDVESLIALVNLEEKANTLSKDLSGGQRQRLSVALALINHPKVVFLDEPTTGLDPQARRKMWETIRAVQQSGATVFLTTHIMEEAQLLCDRVAIVDAGKIIALDKPTALTRQHFQETVIEFELLDGSSSDGSIQSLKGITRPPIYEEPRVTVYTDNVTATLGELTDRAEAGTIKFDSLVVRNATLEDVFLKLTGKHIRE